MIFDRCRSPCGSVDLNIAGCITEPTIKGRSPCGSVDLNNNYIAEPATYDSRSPCGSVSKSMKRADHGSFYFSLFSQFYMHQTNKLRKEKSKNSLKYNYEKGENK